MRSTVLADNYSDNYSIIQAGIDKAYGLKNNYQDVYGTVKVLLPPGRVQSQPLTVPTGVELVSNRTLLIARANGYLISIEGCGRVTGLAMLGRYGDFQAEGIDLKANSNGAILKDVYFDGFYGRALIDRGYANKIDNLRGFNLFYNQADTLPAYAGGIELVGADGQVDNCEVSTRGNAGLSASKFAAALLVNGPNYRVNKVIAETSDVGVVIDAGATELDADGVRGELCYGHGWHVKGGDGRISNSHALRNSRQTDSGYNEWHVDGAASSFLVSNLQVKGNSTGNKANYGIGDFNFSASSFNRYIVPSILFTYNAIFTQNVSGTQVVLADGPMVGISGTTPNIRMGKIFFAANASPVTISAFQQSFSGQHILIRGDGLMTVPNNASFVTLSGANTLLASGVFYEFLRSGAVWYQVR